MIADHQAHIPPDLLLPVRYQVWMAALVQLLTFLNLMVNISNTQRGSQIHIPPPHFPAFHPTKKGPYPLLPVKDFVKVAHHLLK